MNKTPQLRALSSTLRQGAAFLRAQAALETNRSKKQKLITGASELNKAANSTNAKTNNIKKGLNRLANLKKRKTALLSKMRARELEKKRRALNAKTAAQLRAVQNGFGTASARTVAAGTARTVAAGTARTARTAATAKRYPNQNATASRTVRKR